MTFLGGQKPPSKLLFLANAFRQVNIFPWLTLAARLFDFLGDR